MVKALIRTITQLDIDAVISEAIDETEDLRVDLIRKQLYAGFLSDGSTIVPKYAPLTISIKRSQGKISDHVTLLDHGDLYAGIVSEGQGNFIFSESRDSKSPGLEKKYERGRGKLYGLNEYSKGIYIAALREIINKKIKERTGL